MPTIETRVTALENAAHVAEPQMIAFSWVPPEHGLASFKHAGKLYRQPPGLVRAEWLEGAGIAAQSPAFVWLDYDNR